MNFDLFMLTVCIRTIVIEILLTCVVHTVVREHIRLQPYAFPYRVIASDIVVVIRNNLHISGIEKAKSIKSNIIKQARETNEHVIVKMLHEDWAAYGGWTVFPLIDHLYKAYGDKKWIFFCEETTKVELNGLLAILSRHSYNENVFLGHALFDSMPVIIHHFKFMNNSKDFKYPDFDAGWAISKGLLKQTFERLQQNKFSGFAIDVKHEVALYFYDEGNGTKLIDIPAFCINKPIQLGVCATSTMWEAPNCGEVDADNIMVSVKTSEKFHHTRIPVVQKTIGLHAKNIVYYSNVVDKTIPTECADVANIELGQCQNFFNILQLFSKDKWRKVPWLVIIDDNTIMNFNSLQKMLACYDPKVAMVLGERYAFLITEAYGYEYAPGGGGIVLSRPAVQLIVNSMYKCHNNDDPGDMWLGAAIKQLRIPLINTNSFHQAQPNQYNEEFLSHRYLVSFRIEGNMNPMDAYKKYLTNKHVDESSKNNQIRDEL